MKSIVSNINYKTFLTRIKRPNEIQRHRKLGNTSETIVGR
jgi:hypothetical protein